MSHETTILKHPLNVRIFHYLLIVSFLPLAVTGLLLYFKPLQEDAMNLTAQIHVAAGTLLTLAAAAFFLIGFDRVILFVKRVFSFSDDDIKWFSVLGGYPQKILMKKKIPLPPMGKYNAGQKLFGVCVLIGGTILIGTGLILWAFPHNVPRSTVAFLGQLHTVFGWILTLFLPIHLFLGIYMFDDFKAMILNGRIPYEEAKEASPLWVKDDIVPLNS
jgi:formate dehydrogenase subunit gamma